MNLWLDDVRDPAKWPDKILMYGSREFVWAKTAGEAIDHLQTGRVVFASLDHDLNGDNWEDMRTGYAVVCWMEENNIWPPEGVQVHSMNPVGRERMLSVINRHYKS